MNAVELRERYRDLYQHWLETGENQSATRQAYQDYFKQACAEGDPPDALVPRALPEADRFFAQVLQGTDGHAYWNGTRRFRRDKGQREPRYWWYEHTYGELGRGKLTPLCGENHCIAPAHQHFTPWFELRQRYTDQQLIGALQTVAMRLGRTPTVPEYNRERRRGPTSSILFARFGNWKGAMKAAGLTPSPKSIHRRTPEQCIEALRFVAKILGHPPSFRDYGKHTEALREAGLPPGTGSIRTHLGRWGDALRKAGLR